MEPVKTVRGFSVVVRSAKATQLSQSERRQSDSNFSIGRKCPPHPETSRLQARGRFWLNPDAKSSVR